MILENKNGNWIFETKKWKLTVQDDSRKVTLRQIQDNSVGLKNKADMVIGNVIGSNVLNIVLVVPMIGFLSKIKT